MYIELTSKNINSLVAFRYLYWIWRLIGLYPPKAPKLRKVYHIYALSIIFCCYIFLPIAQLTKLYFAKDWEDTIKNLSVVSSFITSNIKFFIILSCRHYLFSISIPLSQLDLRVNLHVAERIQLFNAIRLCHIYCLIFMILYNFVGFGYAYLYWLDRELIGWLPVILKNENFNYLLSFWFFFIAQTYAVIQNVNNDIYPICHLIIMVAQQRALNERVARIGKGVLCNVSKNKAELVACIHDYNSLLSYFDCIQKPISRTILIQFLVMAIVLCVNAINLMIFENDVTQLLFTGAYLFSVLIEVFPCCWLVNELMKESDALTTALYSCNWYEQDQPFRKTLIIFMQRSQQKLELLAGNVAPITLNTFTEIVRFSFSVYTLMTQMHN